MSPKALELIRDVRRSLAEIRRAHDCLVQVLGENAPVVVKLDLGELWASAFLKDLQELLEKEGRDALAKVIGLGYPKAPRTELDPRLEGEFKLYNWPGIAFRVHPNCDGLICHDGEIVIQSNNGPNGEWLDFVREQQGLVLKYLA